MCRDSFDTHSCDMPSKASVSINDEFGIHLTAQLDIANGEIVLVSHPLFTVPTPSHCSHVCTHCCRIVSCDGDSPFAQGRCCPKCQQLVCTACASACAHGELECLASQRLFGHESCRGGDGESMVRVALRLLVLRRAHPAAYALCVGSPRDTPRAALQGVLGQDGPAGLESASGAGLPGLVTHRADAPDEMITGCEEAVQQCLACVPRALVEADSSSTDPLSPETHPCGLAGELVCGLLAWCYNAWSLLRLAEPTGAALYYGASFINHACAPNCYYACDDSGAMTVVASRNIQAGEQLFLSYTRFAKPRRTRRARLRACWLFDCACDRCAAPIERSEDRFLEGCMCRNCPGVCFPVSVGPPLEWRCDTCARPTPNTAQPHPLAESTILSEALLFAASRDSTGDSEGAQRVLVQRMGRLIAGVRARNPGNPDLVGQAYVRLARWAHAALLLQGGPSGRTGEDMDTVLAPPQGAQLVHRLLTEAPRVFAATRPEGAPVLAVLDALAEALLTHGEARGLEFVGPSFSTPV
eukprot:gnl/Trimastix_PCT/1078.p1 GENE.gnl/Trimastix_PCT/1078~~gnl/Trimastix_PCT/1078.p1  ORF type:complete len:527 (+),score=95.18 gnl/Trimastix_PCT/1078:1100-2680(+)